jgi:hypothetical protein
MKNLCHCGNEAWHKYKTEYRCTEHRGELDAMHEKDLIEFRNMTQGLKEKYWTDVRETGLNVGDDAILRVPIGSLFGVTIKTMNGTIVKDRRGYPAIRLNDKLLTDRGWKKTIPWYSGWKIEKQEVK